MDRDFGEQEGRDGDRDASVSSGADLETGTDQHFSGGHYGGFANEGHSDEGQEGRAAWSADETSEMREVQHHLRVQPEKS